jgi:hypothetical protein
MTRWKRIRIRREIRCRRLRRIIRLRKIGLRKRNGRTKRVIIRMKGRTITITMRALMTPTTRRERRIKVICTGTGRSRKTILVQKMRSRRWKGCLESSDVGRTLISWSGSKWGLRLTGSARLVIERGIHDTKKTVYMRERSE